MVKLGFAGSVLQLVGFAMGIYVFYDWNEMEPYTWIFCKYSHSICCFFLYIFSHCFLTLLNRVILSHGRLLLLPLVLVWLGLHISVRRHETKKVKQTSRCRRYRLGPNWDNEKLRQSASKIASSDQRRYFRNCYPGSCGSVSGSRASKEEEILQEEESNYYLVN